MNTYFLSTKRQFVQCHFAMAAFMLCLSAPTTADDISSSTFSDCLIEPFMEINVGSAAQGIIRDIPVRRGESIEQDQLLAILNTEVEEVAIELANARLEYLEEQYQRLSKLQKRDMVSAEQFDEVEIERHMATLDLRRNQILLSQKKITSKVKGVVTEVILSPGEYVHEQSPILTVAQTDPLNVEVLLPVALYPRVSVGQKASVTVADPIGGTYPVEVDIIDRVLDAASASFGVRFKLPNPDLSMPAGLRCTLKFDQ